MTSVRFLNSPTATIELTTTTHRVLLNCGAEVLGKLAELPTTTIIPSWRPGHIEGLSAAPDIPVYGEHGMPLPAALHAGEFTITPWPNALVIADGDHLYVYAASALTVAQATAMKSRLPRKLKMLFLEATQPPAIAVCTALAPEIVAATPALNAALDTDTRALVLAPEPALYYTVDAN